MIHLRNPGGVTKSNKINPPKNRNNYQDFIETKEKERAQYKRDVEAKEEELRNMDKKLSNSMSKNQSLESELYKLKDEIKFLLENDEKNKDIIKQQKKAVNKLHKEVGGDVPE